MPRRENQWDIDQRRRYAQALVRHALFQAATAILQGPVSPDKLLDLGKALQGAADYDRSDSDTIRRYEQDQAERASAGQATEARLLLATAATGGQCEVEVYRSSGRWGDFGRCMKPVRWSVPASDGPLLVCLIHRGQWAANPAQVSRVKEPTRAAH